MSRATSRHRHRVITREESGSAVVDFVMVGALVVFVFVALLQVTLGVYARNVLTDAAGDGARPRRSNGYGFCPTPRCATATWTP